MKPKVYSSQGIIINHRNYGEADSILSIYTKDYGRVAVLAKGARRPESRKRGHLEIFNLINFHAARGKNLDLITEVETKKSYAEIRGSLRKVSLAYYFMEVVGKTTDENGPNKELFEHIIIYLDKLTTQKRLRDLRLDFITKLLEISGFWPRGKSLARPDEKLAEVTERKLSSERVGKMIAD